MTGFLRLLVLLLLLGGAGYLLISLAARSRARQRLEQRWSTGPQSGRREDFIAAGLRRYDLSARRRLLRLLWLLPPAVVAVIVFLTNSD